MIVKSMPGKVGRASFGKLVSYMLKPGRAEHRPAESLIKHNMWSDREDPESLIAELEENAAYQRRGVNRNLLYHEVISPHPEDGHLVTDDILHDLAWEYLARRAPEALALATIHRDIEDEDRPHLHICISGNLVKSDRQLRLSRQEFTTIQRELEEIQRERYPQLTHSLVFGSSRAQEFESEHGVKPDKRHLAESRRRQDRETQRERRLSGEEKRKQGRKEQVREQVAQCVQAAASEEELRLALENVGLSLYQRGKTPGVIEKANGRRYRLKTLGVLGDLEVRRQEWEADKNRLRLDEERKAQMARLRERQAKEQERDKDLGRGRGHGLGVPKFRG